MITRNAALCMDSFEEEDLKFKVHEPEEDTVLELGFSSTDGGPYLRFIIIFDDDNTAISIRCLDFVSYPEELTDEILDLCDEYNSTYRFAKLYTDRDNHTVDAQINTFVTSENVVELTHVCLGMIMESLRDVYPRFMKTIWSGE